MYEIFLISILIFVCSITYSIQMIFGIGGTILMIPALSFFFDVKTLIIYSILPQILVAGIALIKSHKQIDRKELLRMFIVVSCGVIIGSIFFKKIPYSYYHILLALIIITAGLFMIFSPEFKIGKKRKWLLDFLSGFFHSVFAISGPIIMTRLMATYRNKTKIRNSACAFYIGVNIFRGFNYTIHHSINFKIWKMILVSSPFLLVVFVFADKLHYKIKDEVFKKYLAWIILISGVFLLSKFLLKYN